MKGFACPCCGYLTMSEPASGTYEICPVCMWEDDDVQLKDPAYVGGANTVSLNEARDNYKSFGAMDRKYLKSVRKPKPDEMPD